jgi:hypothetical protein
MSFFLYYLNIVTSAVGLRLKATLKVAVGDFLFRACGRLVVLHRPLHVFWGLPSCNSAYYYYFFCFVLKSVGVAVPYYSLFTSMPVGIVFGRGVKKLKYRGCTGL